jgi:hypothetical protein
MKQESKGDHISLYDVVSSHRSRKLYRHMNLDFHLRQYFHENNNLEIDFQIIIFTIFYHGQFKTKMQILPNEKTYLAELISASF